VRQDEQAFTLAVARGNRVNGAAIVETVDRDRVVEIADDIGVGFERDALSRRLDKIGHEQREVAEVRPHIDDGHAGLNLRHHELGDMELPEALKRDVRSKSQIASVQKYAILAEHARQHATVAEVNRSTAR
jgi:hypothetical protein